jgi:hypothetical protein
VGQTATANFTLSPAGTSQTVEVSATSGLLSLENPNTSTTLSAETIKNLPNPGQDLTFVAQFAKTTHGAWDFHEHLIPNSPAKPLRIWMEVGDRDLLNPNVMRDNMHDWVGANEDMAKVLAAKGYHYQFAFAHNAGHVDHAVKQQTLPEALEYGRAIHRRGKELIEVHSRGKTKRSIS